MLHHQIPFLYVFPYLFMICLCVLYYIPMYSSIILFCTTYLCNFSIIFFLASALWSWGRMLYDFHLGRGLGLVQKQLLRQDPGQAI